MEGTTVAYMGKEACSMYEHSRNRVMNTQEYMLAPQPMPV